VDPGDATPDGDSDAALDAEADARSDAAPDAVVDGVGADRAPDALPDGPGQDQGTLTCDGPEDCAFDQACCYDRKARRATCEPESCDPPRTLRVCHVADDCASDDSVCCPVNDGTGIGICRTAGCS
jgi:hypothetical protein